MEKNYFCVIKSKKNYRPANSEKNVDFGLSKSSKYAATDTPTSTKSGIENENILLQHNDEIHSAKFLQHFFRINAMCSFTSLVLFECSNAIR